MTRSRTRLPNPQQATARRPRMRSPTYAGLTTRSDALLAKAEEAIRAASCLWSDIDSAIENDLDQMAGDLLRMREGVVVNVRDLYGDRLGQSAL